MNEKIGIVVGESMGEVLEVDTTDDQLAWGRWMRIRVNINVNRPIKRGKMLMVEDGKKVLALFNHERLPDFCYV